MKFNQDGKFVKAWGKHSINVGSKCLQILVLTSRSLRFIFPTITSFTFKTIILNFSAIAGISLLVVNLILLIFDC